MSFPRGTGPHSGVSRESDCRSRVGKFDSGLVPYFRGHSPPSTDSRRVVASYKRKCVHEVMVNCLVKLAEEKCVVW